MDEKDARAVTKGPGHHFFGYFGITPWSASGKHLLCLETTFMGRPPLADDTAAIGMAEVDTGRFVQLAETRAWNWQQGCFLQWLETDPERLVTYNDRRDGRFVSVILDIETGKERVVSRPVAAVSRDGKKAVSINFSRLAVTRPGYGYEGVPDPWEAIPQPEDDGIYIVDLEKNTHKLMISLAQIAPMIPASAEKKLWFNHLQFNTDDSRFCFLARFEKAEQKEYGRSTSFFTAGPDGSEVYCLAADSMVSHFDWKNEEEILAFAELRDGSWRFLMYTDRTDEQRVVGHRPGGLTDPSSPKDQDGHCSWSPDRRWVLNDTYPLADGTRRLMMYHVEDDRLVSLGRYLSPPASNSPAEIRCDLHPRWNRNGTQVCFDSLHEGQRQVYVMDVSKVMAS